MSYSCKWNLICGATPMPFRNGDGEQVRPHMCFSFCLLKWFKQAAYCEWADRVVETSEGRQWFIISFSRGVRHYLHRCWDDPLMCGIAELLTAQWTDKCSHKAVSLVCITLCSCPRWKNNVSVRHWSHLPSTQIFNYFMEMVLFLLRRTLSLQWVTGYEGEKS